MIIGDKLGSGSLTSDAVDGGVGLPTVLIEEDDSVSFGVFGVESSSSEDELELDEIE